MIVIPPSNPGPKWGRPALLTIPDRLAQILKVPCTGLVPEPATAYECVLRGHMARDLHFGALVVAWTTVFDMDPIPNLTPSQWSCDLKP